MPRILVIDDEEAICTSLTFAFDDKYEVMTTTLPSEGYQLLENQEIDIVLLDWRIKDIDGLEVLREIKSQFPHVNVIMMTAYGTIESTVQAMKAGAYYYISKPLNIEQLDLLMEKVLEFSYLTKEVKRLHQSLEEKQPYENMIGTSKAMEKVFQLIDKVKDIDSNILITGESGTGKELVAGAIHECGDRKEGPFEVVNCAAIPENLLESELFGHKKGSFTGAVYDKVGKFISADGGTLFLDEIGELPLSLQSKLLRAIQEREVTPLGDNKKYKVDIRLIAATNRNLLDMVNQGGFREDLYFRLNVIPVNTPPLRERKEDLPLLIAHFIKEHNQKLNKSIQAISAEAKRYLYEYDYPGNVRELSNCLEHAVALSRSEIIEVEDLPPSVYHQTKAMKVNEQSNKLTISLPQKMKDIERFIILETIQYCEGHRKNTASVLGISERNLRNKLNLYRVK